MAARNSPSRGAKPDKLMRDALIVALKEEATDANGLMTTKLRMVASKLVDRAMDGDVPAIKEIGDRVDGRPPQAIIGDDEAAPIKTVLEVMWKSSGEQSN